MAGPIVGRCWHWMEEGTLDGDGAVIESAADFVGDVVHVIATVWMQSGAHGARLSVRPRRGELIAGAAEIWTAAGHVYLVSVVGEGPSNVRFLPRSLRAEAGQVRTVLVAGWDDATFAKGMQLIQNAALRSPEGQLAAIQAQATHSATLRLAAVEILSALGSDAPVDPLLRALDDENWQVRRSAASALAKIGERAPLEPFLRAIRDKSTENQGVRRAAAYLLGAHPSDAPVDKLVELLHDTNDGSVRAAAAYACGRLGARAPVAALGEALGADSAWGIRMVAAQSLGALGAYAPVEPLVAALDGPQRHEVGVEAARALLRLGERVPREAQERARYLLDQDRELLRQLRDRDLEIQALNDRVIEPDTLVGWLHALESPEWQTRASAVQRIAGLGGQAPLETLLAALRDEDPNVAIAAAEGLASLGGLVPMDGRVAAALFAQLDDFEHDEEFAAARAIEALAVYLPIGSLLEHLGDLNWYPRETALKSLVQLGPSAPVAPLVEALADGFADMRPLAAEALVTHHREAIEPALKESEHVLMGGSVGPVLSSLVQIDIAKRIGIWRISSARAIRVLTELLSWPFWQVRWQAIQSLGELDVALPEPVFRQLRDLCADPQSSAVREAAAELLDNRGLA